MTLPALPTLAEVHARLPRIFPNGTVDHRNYFIREMAAKTIFVMLYGAMLHGTGRMLRPVMVCRFSDDQAAKATDAEREEWFSLVVKKRAPQIGTPWFRDNSRESIRDETLRGALVTIGAATRDPSKPVTSQDPIYALAPDFAALFDPALTGAGLDAAIAAWQAVHLTKAALARAAVIASGKVKSASTVPVSCPDGTVVTLSAGPSSLISKAVVEQFAPRFLPNPALIWLSESRAKSRYEQKALAASIGLKIDEASVLPDIILMGVGATGADTLLVFIEVVASDGPMDANRMRDLQKLVDGSGFPKEQCRFGTAFHDRSDKAFRKVLPALAWGSFAWFSAEPDQIAFFVADATGGRTMLRSPSGLTVPK